MKKFYSILFSLLVIGGSAMAAPKISEENINYGYGDAFIFVEGGVEFAVYPDGQFDFFFNSQRNGYNVNVVTPQVNISFNAGHNYDPFVQYDDFGAVIQIENVPVFYDYYGRIIQAGNVYVSYNNFGRISRIGGLRLHYNRYNQYVNYSGFINTYNPHYVYRPWHNYYVRPQAHYAVVHHRPYRAYYNPTRVTYNYHVNYYQTYYNNGYQRSYYRPGEKVTSYHRGSRTTQVRDTSPQRFNSDYSVATRMDDRKEARSNSSSRATRTAVNTKQSSSSNISESRGRNSNVSTPVERSNTTVRDTRSVAKQTPAAPQKRQVTRDNSRSTTRNSAVNTARSEIRTSTPSSRSTGRSATVQSSNKASAPQTTSSSGSRSSRGRGN